MKRFSILALAAALCGAVPAIVLAQASAPDHVTIALNALNDSGETGTATLQQAGPDLLVFVRMKDTVADNQPVHIHEGTCAKLNPKPQYPFPNITARRSQVKLRNVTIASLLATPHAINVHRSTTQAGIYVACGDIKT
ncbi:MAG: hypothetical protein JO359_11505 [Candidatus Eremiobacteraeota bacterium]|nr:hypothetical protein [Candidatus Eremiobacteraeota bacterium]